MFSMRNCTAHAMKEIAIDVEDLNQGNVDALSIAISNTTDIASASVAVNDTSSSDALQSGSPNSTDVIGSIHVEAVSHAFASGPIASLEKSFKMTRRPSIEVGQAH